MERPPAADDFLEIKRRLDELRKQNAPDQTAPDNPSGEAAKGKAASIAPYTDWAIGVGITRPEDADFA